MPVFAGATANALFYTIKRVSRLYIYKKSKMEAYATCYPQCLNSQAVNFR
jgi:hypothetical protein